MSADDNKLLTEALELLEYAAYHDGRYDQMRSANWQHNASVLVRRLAERLNRKPFEGYGK